jgi:hypothetical protein
MSQTYQTFNFTTQSIPLAPGKDGAHWENLPVASFPPVFDISFPNSTANAVAQAMSNISNSFNGLKDTYKGLTQSLQNAACSLDDLISSLKNAQLFAKEFADDHNNTTVYVRTVGLDPVGTINSPQTFIKQVREILNDTGTQPGQLPKITPAEIPLNPSNIANVLTSGGTAVDAAVGGSTQLGGALGGALGNLGISFSVGLNLPVLSNDDFFKNTFPDGQKARDKIRQALIDEKKLAAPGQQPPLPTKSTIPVSELIDILVKYQIVLDADRQIALERLVRLQAPNSKSLGGFVMVGKAPDLGSLVRKVQALSGVMEWLDPLVKKLATAALSEFSASGIDFNPAEVQLNKLNSTQNVGVKDFQAAKKKADDAKLSEFEMPTLDLISSNENPAPGNFKAWKKFKPAQLFPGLESLGKISDTAEDYVQGATAAAVNTTVGTLANLIEQGQGQLQNGLNFLEGQAGVIDEVANQLNGMNDQLVQGMNWLKNKFGAGPISMDSHLIGPKLNILSNAQFADAIEDAINDVTDPNRPTFGPPASEDVFQTQTNLNAALQGVPSPTKDTTIWFGLVIVIIDKKIELGSQMSTIANLLNMDDSSIDIPKKKKLTFPPKF